MTLVIPQKVFFDWDGTLVDSFLFLHAAHNYARQQLGIEPFAVEEFEGYFGQPREILYVKIYGDQSEEAKTHFEHYVRSNHLDGLHPIDGALEVLQTLEKLNIPCGVVTNKKRTLVEAEIKAFGWSDYFDVLIGAADAANDKPSPDPLLMAMDRSTQVLDTEQVWFVGDTDNDTACSNAVGTKTILILDPVKEHKKTEEILGNYHIDLHVSDCKKFHEFLLQYD